MHQNAFVGRAPPGHAERAYVLPTPLSREWGPTSRGGGQMGEGGRDVLFLLLLLFLGDCDSADFNNYSYAYTTRYDTRCYFNVRSKADMGQINLPHGTDNYKV